MFDESWRAGKSEYCQGVHFELRSLRNMTNDERLQERIDVAITCLEDGSVEMNTKEQHDELIRIIHNPVSGPDAATAQTKDPILHKPTAVHANLSVTPYINGPFLIVVTLPNEPSHDFMPMVILPTGGFATKDDAVAYVEQFACKEQPYFGYHFAVVPASTPASFNQFVSWSD